MRRRKSLSSSLKDHHRYFIIPETEEQARLGGVQGIQDPLTLGNNNSVGFASPLLQTDLQTDKELRVNHDSQEIQVKTLADQERESAVNEVHEMQAHLHHHDSCQELDADQVEKNSCKSTGIVIRDETRLCLQQDIQQLKNNMQEEKESPSTSSHFFMDITKKNNQTSMMMQRQVINNIKNMNKKRDMESSKSRRLEGKTFYSRSHPFTSPSLTFFTSHVDDHGVPLFSSSFTSSSTTTSTASSTTTANNSRTSRDSVTPRTSHMKSSCRSNVNMSCCPKTSCFIINVHRNYHQILIASIVVLTLSCLNVASEASQYQSVVPTSYSRSDLLPCEEIFKSGHKLPCLCSKEVLHLPSPNAASYPLVSNGSIAVICDGVAFFGDFPSLPYKARIHTFSQRNSFIQGLEPQLFTASAIPLIRIDFSRNRLRRLMERIFDGVESSLIELDLSHNLLGDQLNPIFSSNEFLHLRNLRSLDLSHNELRALDNNLFKGLRNLTVSQ